jgi:hypothetical protein
MEKGSPSYIGVDPTAGRHPFTFAALDHERKLAGIAAGNIDDLFLFIIKCQGVAVAVNAPPRPNHRLVRENLEKEHLAPGQLRGSDMRMAESELRGHGISVSPTPSRVDQCPAWMQMGFDLYRRLEEAGFNQYPAEIADHQWLETHPQAAFSTLIGKVPLPKPTLEGRLQRQIALYEQGVGIKDPMEFFEEITRHKLLHGLLPVDLVYTTEELDTLMAAFMAFCAINCPKEIMLIGDIVEGQIALPVNQLKDRYC